MKGRIISLVLAVGYTVTALIIEGWLMLVIAAKVLVMPLAMIWFPDEIGDYMGFARIGGPYITRKSPGSLIALFGWCFLLAPLVFIVLKIL